MAGAEDIDPFEFVRTIAVARITMPGSVVRLSAGRQQMNDELQALCFMAGANSMFYGDALLTTANPQAQRDRALFARLRDGIREGSLRGEALRRALLSLAPPVRGAEGGYDVLDTLISGALLDEQPPATVRPELQGWDPEMVPYQPTPARIVLELATRLRPTVDDVFCDLGAGLGQVCVLVHLLTGVRAVGIEVDPALWAYSERLARRLGLADVTFFVGDARQADLTMGTLFFLYTPFTGTLLAAVLARIGELAARHRIRVASYGPCTSWVAREGWLMPEDAPADDPERLVLFRSR